MCETPIGSTSGRCTASRPALPAVVLATALVSSVGSASTPSTVTSEVACCRASLTARSCAICRVATASGTRNASATIEVMASARRLSAHLTANTSSRVDHHHADTPHRVQEPGLGGRLPELPAQPRDVYVDGLLLADPGLVPHLVHQLAPADHLPDPLGQVGEHVELAAGQLERLAAQLGPALPRMDDQVADDDLLLNRLRSGARAAQHRVDPG